MATVSLSQELKDIALTIPEGLDEDSHPHLTTPTPTLRKNPRLPAGGFAHTENIASPRTGTPRPSLPPDRTRLADVQSEAEVAIKPRKVFWDEAKGQIRLAAPIVGMNLVQMLLVLSSAAFVGRLGTLELASCQLATTLANASGHYVIVRGLILGAQSAQPVFETSRAGSLVSSVHFGTVDSFSSSSVSVWGSFAGFTQGFGTVFLCWREHVLVFQQRWCSTCLEEFL